MIFLTVSQFAVTDTLEDKFWDDCFDSALGPHARPFETLQEALDFQTVYGMSPSGGRTGPVRGVPKNPDGRIPQYLCEEDDARGQNHWRHRW